MFKQTLTALTLGLGLMVSAQAAYQTYSGVDTAGDWVNAEAASANFQATLQGVGTENFEVFSSGTVSPLVLNFPGAGTATLNGSAKVLNNVSACCGRKPHSGANLVETSSTNFSVNFSQNVAAFGFFGSDIGEFQGNLWLRVTKIGGTTEDINVTDVNDLNSSADGSTLFFGLVASNASEQFTNIEFFDANPAGGDYFGFDDMTVGSLAQVCQNGCNNVPEPSSLPLVGLAFAALGFVGHRRLRNSRK